MAEAEEDADDDAQAEEFDTIAANGEPFMVSTQNVERAREIVMHYILPAFLYCYTGAGNATMLRVRQVADWLLVKMDGEPRVLPSQISARFSKWWPLLSSRERNELIDTLIDDGWLVPVSSYPGERYRGWWLDPHLREAFPDQRERAVRELAFRDEQRKAHAEEARQRKASLPD